MSESKKGNLVLSRLIGESIVFRVQGVEFSVVLGHYTKRRAKLIIQAPESVRVLRHELTNQQPAVA